MRSFTYSRKSDRNIPRVPSQDVRLRSAPRDWEGLRKRWNVDASSKMLDQTSALHSLRKHLTKTSQVLRARLPRASLHWPLRWDLLFAKLPEKKSKPGAIRLHPGIAEPLDLSWRDKGSSEQEDGRQQHENDQARATKLIISTHIVTILPLMMIIFFQWRLTHSNSAKSPPSSIIKNSASTSSIKTTYCSKKIPPKIPTRPRGTSTDINWQKLNRKLYQKW